MGKMKDEAIKEDNNVMDGTMRVWDRVCKTDVDHTKEVSFGRKFTAIDAHSQIMEATRMFGPVGEGWGYRTEYGTIDTGREMYIYCDLTMWWAPAGHWEGIKTPGYHREYGPVRGAAMLFNGKKIDTDAYKKASTDGLTKCLSHLGFNADVFLGQFDDNKYVVELKREKQAVESAKQMAYEQDRKKFIEAIKGCKEPAQMDAVLENYKMWMAGLSVGIATEMRSWVLKQKTELADGSK